MTISYVHRRPISIEHPGGVNPTLLDEFSAIKTEINKLNTVTSKVSWCKVYNLSKYILENKSKDFRCSCYYTVSGTKLYGLSGLIDGLKSLHDISLIYWHSGYPKTNKEKARIDCFNWFIEHTINQQRKLTINRDDLSLVERGRKLTLKIEEELRIHYGTKAPSLSGIRRIFSQWINDIKKSDGNNLSVEKYIRKPEKNYKLYKKISLILMLLLILFISLFCQSLFKKEKIQLSYITNIESFSGIKNKTIKTYSYQTINKLKNKL